MRENSKHYTSKNKLNKEKFNPKKIATTIATIGISIASAFNFSSCGCEKKVENEKPVIEPSEYTIALAQDIPTDEFQNQIPVTVNGTNQTIDINSLLFVYGNLIKDGENNVFFYDENGDLVQGTTNSKYLNNNVLGDITILSKEEIEKYNCVYRISSETENAHIREDHELDSNVITSLENDALILGEEYSTQYSTNNYPWVNVICLNNNKLYRGYISENYLSRVKPLPQMEFPYYPDNRKIVDTSTDGYVDVSLRHTPNIPENYTENIIKKIPHGSLVQVDINNTNNYDDWISVIYKEQESAVENFKGYINKNYLRDPSSKTITITKDTHILQNISGDGTLEETSSLLEGSKIDIYEGYTSNGDAYYFYVNPYGGPSGYIYKDAISEENPILENTKIEDDGRE